MTVDPSTLTLAEKASLLSGRDLWSTQDLPEHDVPAVVLADGPHGVRPPDLSGNNTGVSASLPATCFPPAVGVGASWDRDLAARMGTRLGQEAAALGVNVLLGPGVNIKRSPLCGRNFEYFSEDPHLSGALGASYTAAVEATGTGTAVKHFAANNQETDRMQISSDIDERTLREIYLPAFETVVTTSRPAMVMTAYNKVNGVPASANPHLITEILKTEWGFDGVVVSDWGAVSDPVAALAAGLDLEMPGTIDSADRIINAVTSGRIAESVVDDAVRRVLQLGAFVRPASGSIDIDAGHALAKDLALGCAVLLRNTNDTLPLDQAARIAVIGEFAVTPRYQGGGSSHVTPTRVDAALDSITALASRSNQQVTYAPGFRLRGNDQDPALIDDAVRAAHGSDIAIVFVGLAAEDESEGFDRTSIDLPQEQVAVIQAVAATGTKTVVVLSHGGVVSLEGWHDDVDAILDATLLGQAGGSAIADLLYGVVSPSGHLAETIPLTLKDTPSYLTFPGEQGHSRYGEGVMVGYRHFSSLNRPVRYPFGHGLSYTTFHTEDLTVEVTGSADVTARVTVTNTGSRRAAHVVQLYVATEEGPVRRPVRELRGFDKITLDPGETRTVTLTLNRRAFAYWDIDAHDWVVAPGRYSILIGDSVDTIVAVQAVELAGEPRAAVLSLDSAVGEWFAHPVVGSILIDGLTAAMGGEEQNGMGVDGLRMVESMPMRQFLGFTQGAFTLEAAEQLLELSRT